MILASNQELQLKTVLAYTPQHEEKNDDNENNGSMTPKTIPTIVPSRVDLPPLSTKAVSRALRGHILIESALVCKLMTQLIASGQENRDSCEEMERPTFEEATVYDQFARGNLHTVRRSEQFWSGLWMDLDIEQVMIRALKSNGGLTRERGISESTRQLWIGSIHRCADIPNAMSESTGAYRKTSEQHVQLGPSRETIKILR
eukprot:gene16691-8138_t